MGRQKTIARAVAAKQGDYTLALKENHPEVYAEAQELFAGINEPSCSFPHSAEVTKDHGRIERRSVTTVPSPDRLESKGNRQDMATLIRYRCEGTAGRDTTVTDHYSISNMTVSAKEFATLTGGHWSIGNQLHWSLDVLFREDASRVSKDHVPGNPNIPRKIGLGRLRATGVPDRRLSTKRKIFKVSVNPDFLYSVLFGK
jgi:hypothetical protein